ncbi:hypothetical protein D3C72_1458910 [compost metagenome]
MNFFCTLLVFRQRSSLRSFCRRISHRRRFSCSRSSCRSHYTYWSSRCTSRCLSSSTDCSWSCWTTRTSIGRSRTSSRRTTRHCRNTRDEFIIRLSSGFCFFSLGFSSLFLNILYFQRNSCTTGSTCRRQCPELSHTLIKRFLNLSECPWLSPTLFKDRWVSSSFFRECRRTNSRLVHVDPLHRGTRTEEVCQIQIDIRRIFTGTFLDDTH